MALVVKDKPLTIARVRASVIYRLGAVPRGGAAGERRCPVGVDRDVRRLRRQLDIRTDEVEMLRNELTVARADAECRDQRIGALEDEVSAHAVLLARLVRSARMMSGVDPIPEG